MRMLPLSAAVVLVVGAAALLRAVATRDGVGVLEYAVSALLILLLLRTALAAARHARRG
jgi:hypothetical protein